MPRMNRRTFIGSAAAAALLASRSTLATGATGPTGATAAGGAAEASHKLDRIGVQLYTVREMMKTDFEGTLAKVAGVGYREVEFAGYFDHQPKEIRALLDKVASHGAQRTFWLLRGAEQMAGDAGRGACGGSQLHCVSLD